MPGDNCGSAILINHSGTIIGWSANIDPATIFNRSCSSRLGGWTIDQVMSINNSGQVAVVATRNGVTSGILLTPVL